jgi:hypothetical protein
MKPWVLGLLDKLPIDPLTSTAALFVSFQAHLRLVIMIQLYIHGAEALGVIFLRVVSYSSQKGIHACLGIRPWPGTCIQQLVNVSSLYTLRFCR